MYPLELWLLKQFCKRYGIDIQEIDDSLSYYENKEHLQKLHLEAQLPRKDYGPLAVDIGGLLTWKQNEARWESEMEWYVEHHILEEYIAYRDAGWTASEEVGELLRYYPRFSLEEFVQDGRRN